MITLPAPVIKLIRTFQKNGFEIYAVGGSVRDMLIGKSTKGWDFTTNATPEEIIELFPDSFYDNQFGTVGIKIFGDDKAKPEDIYEVTTFRSERNYTDFRHPEVVQWGTSLEEDLSRRDFTINAIAYDGKTINDPFGGQQDLIAKRIKTVGEPDRRFSEDALRMMRAIRQASELGFDIDSDTLTAIKKNVQLIKNISSERIRDEFFKLLTSQYASDGILIAKNSGILQVILPEFVPAFDIQQKSPKRHHIFDVGTHSITALKHCPSRDPIVLFSTLLHDIGKIQTYKKDSTGLITFYNHEVVGARIAKHIALRFRLSNKQVDRVYLLVRWHQFTVDEHQTDSALRRFIRHVGKENLNDMLALRTGDRLGGGATETSWRTELFKKRLDEVQLQPFSVNDLKIDGFDIMKELNVKPGPIIGELLNKLFAEVEAETLINEREALLIRLAALFKAMPQN